jgi:hypothetical protein
MSYNLSETQNFKLGIVIAVVEGIILQPTVYWKNTRIQKKPFTLNPFLLYRGTFAAVCNEMQSMGLQFSLTRFFQGIYIDESSTSLTDSQMIISAFTGGVAASIFATPCELVMIQQQYYGGSTYGTISAIIKDYGYANMFRGLLPTVGRESMYVTGLLGITPAVQNKLMKEYNMSQGLAGFYASIIGGLVSAIPSHPFDICKTCMQGDISKTQYGGLLGTYKKLIEEGGIKRLTHGLLWRSFGIVSTVYIANELRTLFPPLLFTNS